MNESLNCSLNVFVQNWIILEWMKHKFCVVLWEKTDNVTGNIVSKILNISIKNTKI